VKIIDTSRVIIMIKHPEGYTQAIHRSKETMVTIKGKEMSITMSLPRATKTILGEMREEQRIPLQVGGPAWW